MRILITGAAGFIGQHLTRELETDHDVFMVDRHHGVDLHRRGAIELALDVQTRRGGSPGREAGCSAKTTSPKPSATTPG